LDARTGTVRHPLISAIGWVSEFVAMADGLDIFADRAVHTSTPELLQRTLGFFAADVEVLRGGFRIFAETRFGSRVAPKGVALALQTSKFSLDTG